MVSDVSPLAKYPENLKDFGITFGLHLKWPLHVTERSPEFKAYDFDCQVIKQVKAFLWTTSHTQLRPSTGYCFFGCLIGNKKRILQSLNEINNLLRQHTPQPLEVLKMKNILTLIVETFFSEIRIGSYDMPLQLHWVNFRFSRVLNEHFKQQRVEHNSATTQMPSLINKEWNLI